MKRYVVPALAVLLALGLLAFQPKLFLIALVGAAVGGVGALIVFYQSRRDRSAEARSRSFLPGLIVVAAALLAALGVVVAIILDNAESPTSPRPVLKVPHHHFPFGEGGTEAGPHIGPHIPPFHRLEKSVAAVPYEGDFRYEDSGKEGPHWHAEETVRVVRTRFAQMSVGKLAAATLSSLPLGTREPAPVRTALGPQWVFNGDLAEGRVVSYRRVRNVPVDVPLWPPTREAAVGIGAIASNSLAVVLVPSNGSKIEMHAPANLVRETNPPARRQQFDGEDILTVELNGLEGNAGRRVLHLEVAGWIGRTSIYGALDDLTAWTIVKLLFAGVPGAFVAFFVTRRLKRRFPDAPAPQPA